MFNPSDSSRGEEKSINLNALGHIKKNGPEDNLNEMPDLSTFDNKERDHFNQLVGKKTKSKISDNNPHKSMKNLKQTVQEVLPIYKRRAYNRGPMNLKDNTYNGRAMHTQYSNKAHNAWVTDHATAEGEENYPINQRGPVKGKPFRTGRQPSDFRINKTKINPKNRGKTANGKRKSDKQEITSNGHPKIEKAHSNIVSRPPASRSNPNKTQGMAKRAQSQHNQRKKLNRIEEKAAKGNTNAAIGKHVHNSKKKESKEEENEINDSEDEDQRQSDKVYDDENDPVAKDISQMIKYAEDKIRATAEAMLLARQEDDNLNTTIKNLSHIQNGESIEEQQKQPETRKEKIANIVEELVAQNTDLPDADDNPYEDQEVLDHQNMFPVDSSNLEPIKEQFTEEGYGVYDNEGPDQNYDVETIFESQVKSKTGMTKECKEVVQETPVFGQNYNSESTSNLFSSYLCYNELSTQKKQQENKVIKMEEPPLLFEEPLKQEVIKNILPYLEQDHETK